MASNVKTERHGIAAVDLRAIELGWFFRESIGPDEGIDGQLESSDDEGRPNGRLLAVQVKSGESYFRSSAEDGWWYWIKPNNKTYWDGYSLPVVLLLHNPASGEVFWQVYAPAKLTETSSGGWKIAIPASQVLSEEALPHLERLANDELSDDQVAANTQIEENRAELDIGWIELLARGGRLVVEAGEWQNKSSGRSVLRLLAVDPDNGEEVERDWPTAFLPGASFSDQLQEMFPWATLSIDESYYREATEPQFALEHGHWDEEDGQYRFDADFDEWFGANFHGQLRPHGETGGGEVALWRLELHLNDLGKAELSRKLNEAKERAAFDWTYEEHLANSRANGHYEFSDWEWPGGRRVEFVAFVSDEFNENIAEGTDIWSTPDSRTEVARALLRFAIGREPTDALVAAFFQRFEEQLNSQHDGGGWLLPSDELQSWFAELQVNVPR